MSVNKNIRLAAISDSERLVEIYTPYVKNTVISFEYEVPTIEEFGGRIQKVSERFPWLVCEIDGKIAGYAYASKHRERAAYQWSVDFSVYIDSNYHRKGIATSLYFCLVELLKLQGYYNAYAGITTPNIKSEGFHEAFGFKPVGTYHNVGYKSGRWHDVKWLELTIMEHKEAPAETKTINEIKDTTEFNDIIEKGIRLIKD